ncbi:MAG: alpha/beta fold hydrolase [Anaerolineae bacterium]|nr:alpha/beta fold hydrolase [Anaerolineae bacterium]
MKKIVRFGLAIVLGLGVILPGAAIIAQDEVWTCDEGPNDILVAAEAANGEVRDLEGEARVEKLTEAYWLAAQGEALCVTNPDRFRDAQRLRRNTATRLQNIREFPLGLEPGKVDLEDYGLFMVCAGEGSPTVIFEHGWGNARNIWDSVQPAVSTVTRNCVYDRLGVGLSDQVSKDSVRTTQDQVDDLLLLLDAAGIDPPYILVGHSMAGYNLLLVTDQNPDLVSGLVLVDAVHPDYFGDMAEADSDFHMTEPLDNINSEHFDAWASSEQVAHIQNVGSRPLVVLTAGIDLDEDPIWETTQADFLTFSPNSRQVIAERSRHVIMFFEPELVIDAILWVIDEARAAEK